MAGTPTAGVINGTDLLLYIDSTHIIASSTSCSITLNSDMRDTSNKDSAGWKAVLPGQKNFTLQVEGLLKFTDTYNASYLLNCQINKTLISFYVKTGNSADLTLSGTCYVTSTGISAANEANATYNASFQGTGALTVAN